MGSILKKGLFLVTFQVHVATFLQQHRRLMQSIHYQASALKRYLNLVIQQKRHSGGRLFGTNEEG